MIDYKTYDEQIEILKSRGLIITDDEYVKNFLIENNYYNVINAYKDAFIEKGVTPDKFINGTSFQDIQSLYVFDKTMRLIFSDRLIDIERTFKSVLAHEFSKTHLNHDYLNVNNFDVLNYPIESSKLVTQMAEILYNEEQKQNKMICHYKNIHNVVPLWVFMNVLTFGNVSYFFSCMKQSDKKNVCIQLSAIFNNRLTPPDVKNSIKIANLLRNKAAHDQRIFDFNSYPLTVSQNHPLLKKYKISTPPYNLFGAICCLYDFTNKDKFNNFVQLLSDCAQQTIMQVKSIDPKKIIDITGIPYDFLGIK